MPLYRATGNLVIRPCETCLALVLHEEGAAANEATEGEEMMHARWRPFPHHAPGGVACIGGGSMRTAGRKTVQRPAAAARRVQARVGKRQ
ncbi:hypothetical protein [Vulgatibacter sp.]|uniref:hypothetical protein n=1 Tax=Vulgatibacter sp. TaxID=1971226 RepID=UPI00356AA7EB